MSIYDLKWKCGCHTQFQGSISETLKTSIDYGMYATQFFLGNPQSFSRSKVSEDDLKMCSKLLKEYPMDVFSHFPYLSNLAGSVDSLAWNGDSKQDGKTKALLKSLEYELGILAKVGNSETISQGVVIHPGNYKDREVGLKTIAKSINLIDFPENSKLLLENSAGKGVSLATTFEEISKIIEGVSKSKRKHIGVCVDTCHIFDYGEYDLRDTEEVDRMFDEFDNEIGLQKLSLIHLNDSVHGLKSRRDQHACLGTGHIWNDNMDALRYFMERSKEIDVPIVLETHGMDMITLSLI